MPTLEELRELPMPNHRSERFSIEVKTRAIELYKALGYNSYRVAAEQLEREIGRPVSYGTVRNWVLKNEAGELC